MKDNLFAALGALIVPAVIDKAVDSYVTSDGLANIMKGEKPGSRSPGTGVPAHQYVGESEYIGLDRFRVKLRDASSNEEGPALLFERRGIIDWKLIRIELPSSLFADQGGLNTSDQQAPDASESPSLSDTAPTGNPSPNGTATPFAYIDTETQKLPSVGQCFFTTVHDTGGRLEGDLTSGTSVGYEDGHAMVDYEQHANIQAWRAGDPVRLCVTDLPKDCPAGDNRGVGYEARNQRTGEVWRAGDSEHECGGA